MRGRCKRNFDSLSIVTRLSVNRFMGGERKREGKKNKTYQKKTKKGWT